MLFTKNRKAFNILLLLFFAYQLYICLSSTFYPSRFSMAEQDFIKTFQNPLSAIFLYREVYTLESLAFFALFAIGIAQYFISAGKRRTVLLCYLVSKFMISTAYEINSIFDMAKFPNVLREHWQETLINLVAVAFFFVVLYILINGLQSSREKISNVNTAPQNLIPMKWSRGMHQLFDYFMIFGISSVVYKLMNRTGSRSFDADMIWEYVANFAALVVSYFLAEATFGTTAAKALTGMEVVKSEDGTTPSKQQILGRTFARFIPFEPFSVLSKKLWHDRLSGTALTYTGNENWLSRQSRIMYAIFACVMAVGIWNTICAVLLFADHNANYYQSAIELPVALLIVVVPYTAFLFTHWIASIANYSHNLGNQEVSNSNQFIIDAFLIWIPIRNFKALYNVQAEAYEDLSRVTGETKEMENLSLRATQLSRAFSAMYVLLAIGIFYMFADNWKTRMAFPAFFIGTGIVIWSLYAMLHARAIRNVFNSLQTTYPTTTPAPSGQPG